MISDDFGDVAALHRYGVQSKLRLTRLDPVGLRPVAGRSRRVSASTLVRLALCVCPVALRSRRAVRPSNASRLTLARRLPRCGDALDAGLSVVCALPAVVVVGAVRCCRRRS